MKNKKLIPTFALLVLLSTSLLAIPAFAQGTSASKGGFFQGLITFIEQRFGLDKTQVQTAINDYKSQNKPTPRPTLTPEQIQAQEKTRLDKLVSAGKITGDQETAILNELSSLRTQYNLSGLTGTQRKTQIQAMQTALKTWATDNNINIAYIMPMFGGFGRRGMRRPGGYSGNWGPSPSVTTTPTPTP